MALLDHLKTHNILLLNWKELIDKQITVTNKSFIDYFALA